MNLKLIENYKTVNMQLAGSTLTDYLIILCIYEEKGMKCTVERTDKGKPVVLQNGVKSGIHVSVSHSQEFFACIVADFNIGLDIQQERDIDVVKISERYYTDEETELVKSDRNEFFRLWARKEAYSKYTGEGLEDVIRKTDVLNRRDVTFKDMTIYDEPGSKFYISVCADKGDNIDEIQISHRK